MIGTVLEIVFPTTAPEIDTYRINTIGVEEFCCASHIWALAITFESVQNDNEFIGCFFRVAPIQINEIIVRQCNALPLLLHSFYLTHQPGIYSRDKAIVKDEWWVVCGFEDWQLGFCDY